MSNEQSIRDEIAREIRAVTDGWAEPLDEVHDVPQIVNAILASPVIRRIQAEAVRKVAEMFPDNEHDVGVTPAAVRKWLNARAFHIERGETA